MSVREDIDGMLAAARARLVDVPREALGQWRAPKKVLGISRAPRLWPAGAAWHLGVLLLTDDALLATGEIVRAREEVRRGFAAESQRERAEVAAAAFRGGFAEGQAVHIGWHEIDLDAVAVGPAASAASAPLVMREDVVLVAWSPRGALMPLARYLDEHVALAVDPPRGAT
ncbi:MAG: glutaminase [Microbacterium sp.]|uniref:glutaminase n=1 Tax=Microbacterium sp. TaxID=51671 RepID=UPI0039E33E50